MESFTVGWVLPVIGCSVPRVRHTQNVGSRTRPPSLIASVKTNRVPSAGERGWRCELPGTGVPFESHLGHGIPPRQRGFLL